MRLGRRQLLEALSATGMAAFALTIHRSAGALAAEVYSDEFTPTLRQVLAALADTILPRTSTPGATDAGVLNFIEYMMRYGVDSRARAAFLAGADSFAMDATRHLGGDFARARPDKRLDYVAALDQEYFASRQSRPERAALLAFVATVKRLTVIGYYTSDRGAHAELDVKPFPGPFQGAVKVDPKTRTYYEDSFGVPLERPPGYLSTHD